MIKFIKKRKQLKKEKQEKEMREHIAEHIPGTLKNPYGIIEKV